MYKDYTSSFNDLLRKDGSVSIHHRNLQALAIELYKVKNKLSTSLMQDIFQVRNYAGPYLRYHSDFVRAFSHSTFKGQNSLRSLGPIILK